MAESPSLDDERFSSLNELKPLFLFILNNSQLINAVYYILASLKPSPTPY